MRARFAPLLAVALAAPSLAGAQPVVRVRAETRIELRVERTGEGATLHATLRDDRGDPLPDRAIGLRVFAVESNQAIARSSQQTDATGRVSASFELPLTQYRVEADYRGDERYRSVRVEQRLDLARAHVRLGMALEGEGRLDRLDLGRPEHRFRVSADSDVGGDGLVIILSNELREELATATTDADGIARFAVGSPALGPPAAGRLVVRTPGDERRAAAQTEVLVIRYLPTELLMEASPRTLSAEQPVRVTGVLRNASGPLARKAVGLYADEQHLATVLTDDQGRYERDLSLPDASGEVSLLARFESDAPWRPDASSAALTVRVETQGATPWQWLLISIAVCLVLVVVFSRRGRRASATSTVEAVDAPAAPGIAAAAPTARAPTVHRVAGVVFDAQERHPLTGATITLISGAGRHDASADPRGEFDLGEPDQGTWTLRVSARGYEEREKVITVPHRGEWADARVGLLSLRHVVLQRFRPLAEALSPTRRWWAFWTARELASRAESGHQKEVSNLTDHVEEAAYAAPPPTADEVAEIGRRASHLADRIEPRS